MLVKSRDFKCLGNTRIRHMIHTSAAHLMAYYVSENRADSFRFGGEEGKDLRMYVLVEADNARWFANDLAEQNRANERRMAVDVEVEERPDGPDF